MNLEYLQRKAQTKLDRLEEIRNQYAETDLSDAIKAEVRQLTKDLEQLEKDFQEAKKVEELQKRWNEPEHPPLILQMKEEERNRGQGAQFPDGARIEPGGTQKTVYRSFGEQIQDVIRAYSQNDTRAYERLHKAESETRAATGLGESVPSEGGFLIEHSFSNQLLRETYDTGLLIKRCNRIPVGENSNGFKAPGVDETSRANGSRWGGVQIYAVGEGTDITATKPKFRMIDLELIKVAGLCYVTEELMRDSTAMGAYVQQAFSEEFGFKFDDYIMRGTGAGQPLGILNSGALVSQTAEDGQAATTIVAENIEKMYSRMLPRSLKNAVWYINQECWPQIFQFHHVVGTGGVPMFIPGGNIANAPFGTLLGRPIEVVEQASALGTVGDIIFADLSRYLWIDKGKMETATSIHVRFVQAEQTLRFIARINGQPMMSSAITPYKGSNDLSPFVALATRS